MSIVSTIGNIYFVYQFLKKLVTPFEKTKAFELGIIDEKGKILKRRRDLKTKDEKEAYTLSDTLIWNIKKLLQEQYFVVLFLRFEPWTSEQVKIMP